MQRTNFDVICASLDRPFIFIAVTNGHPVSANQILQTIEACATRKYANRNVWRLLLCVSKFVFSTIRKRNQTSGQYEVFAQCTVLATHFLYFICLHSIVCCCCCSKDSRSGKLCVYIDHAEQEHHPLNRKMATSTVPICQSSSNWFDRVESCQARKYPIP